MVEVFKTNVQNDQHAQLLIEAIYNAGVNYMATFDLQDCDKILRVQCNQGLVDHSLVTAILFAHGYYAEVLQDEIFTLP